MNLLFGARGSIVGIVRLDLIFIVIFIILCGATDIGATHNRAGEITYEQIDDLTIRATIVTYTRTSSIGADRDSLTLHWGDGDSTFVQRVSELEFANDIKKNEYVSDHTYPTRGTYTLSVSDPNRIAGILNIDFPNSINIRFYIETTFTLLESRFQGPNNSVNLLQPPIDFACVDKVYTYNPNAFDMDGDSISYELITPFSSENTEVPNYELPDQIRPGDDNLITLDPFTGDFRWESPKILGEYNITYRINEFRNGSLINSVVRDMQILVRSCPDDNQPPDLNDIMDLCVIAGEEINIDIVATDVDSNELLSITATGGPFELEGNAAMLTVDPALANSMLNGSVRWQTNCSHVSEEYYQIVVRVTDELSKPISGLATLRTIRIKVVAPPPRNVNAVNINGVVTISWESPYACDSYDIFRGFSVWRRVGSATVRIDTCQGGLDGAGYERIVFLTNDSEGGRYFARDVEIEPGQIYCYRVLGEFAQSTSFGNFFNVSRSITSEEVCIRSSGDIPLITNVSVENTSATEGQVLVKWINPNQNAIDTVLLPGPYAITLNGAPNLTGDGILPIEEYTYPSGQFSTISDTSLLQVDLNTIDNGHSYQVEFSSGVEVDNFMTSSDVASSVFLLSTSSDRSVVLSWEENVPWNNFNYNVFQVVGGDRVLIDSSINDNIVIDGLENGIESCFVIESVGSYGIRDIESPLINYSNESCATPNDNVAPCPPELSVESVCDSDALLVGDVFENVLTWDFNEGVCSRAEDVAGYRLYFSESVNSDLEVIQELSVEDVQFIHELVDNVSGCYSIAAIDDSGNEGIISEVICIDNCPSYILPNAFTPNSDSANDLFVPRMNRFISRVDFELFNRWGQKVYATQDPMINWDGTNLSGKELAEGTYFYSCLVFENRVDGETQGEILEGTIQLIR